ncbi:unnamed protein product [Phyllotreta striolata]|uniref:Origin recognition complex subunit 3 n=1 Tax=Phyllotreta striolata TaxID=444603 RepID=A0A9P0GUU3_PHYSR|nr:unnamed protein product [Phyllotreta striolata]
MEDDHASSVSKGVFVFKNNFKPPSRKSSKSRSKRKPVENTLFSSNAWYSYYSTLWEDIQTKIQELNDTIFSSVLINLLDFIKSSTCQSENEEIPTAAFFTGINMPDHMTQFENLSSQLKKTTTPHVAYLQSEDGQSIKNLIENLIKQFVIEDIECEDDLEDESQHKQIKKNLLTLPYLQCWYENKYKKAEKKKPLVIIIPDFEGFNIEILKKFIIIISCYIKYLPFVLVFGIATNINTLHKSLSYKVFSKIRVKVFHSQSSVEYLNIILEEVFFKCPFQLGGNVFNLFSDLFLFYDLSVNNFIQNIKFAVADHFARGNIMTLCSLEPDVVKSAIKELSHDDLKMLWQLPSFKKFLENEGQDKQIKMVLDDEYLGKIVRKEIRRTQVYIKTFHVFLKCLLVLVEDLPKAPLGKQMRVLYAIATSENVTKTNDYQECMKLLNFQSKDELTRKLSKIIDVLEPIDFIDDDLLSSLKQYIDYLNNIDEYKMPEEQSKPGDKSVQLKSSNRWQFKEMLHELAKTPTKALNKYEHLREEIVKTLSGAFEHYLTEPESNFLHEIFFYNNISIKNYIVGSHRSAIHHALNDPHFYLTCDCCKLSNIGSIKPTMPDVCVAYKLHLEYGKMINLYDWLQSFVSIVDAEVYMGDEQMVVRPEMQARFTQAVSELEFLGFIKSSKRKTDHVQRLTWGG